jgi:hypothetical protein
MDISFYIVWSVTFVIMIALILHIVGEMPFKDVMKSVGWGVLFGGTAAFIVIAVSSMPFHTMESFLGFSP